MSRVLIVSTDIVGSTMAGPGIRAWELARTLAAEHRVTLAVPGSSDLQPDGFTVSSYSFERHEPAVFNGLLRQADVVVTQGLVVERYPILLETELPLAIDLYDPMLLEGLDMFAGSEPAEAQAQHARFQALTEAQLQRGDFFFCATERQRDYWLGALTASGRITPELVRSSDRELRDLIDLVPSGIVGQAPQPAAPVLRGVHPAIGADDIVLLWAGGLWDWFEPDLLVRAMAELSVERPRLKLCFFAGARPTAEGEPFRTRTHLRARALAAELEVLDRSVIFLEQWVPYAERGAFLREADAGVSAHRPGIETRFAFRTRLLDYLWANLPVVCTSGDSFGEEIVGSGAGLAVQPGDLAGWVAALRTIADSAELRARCRTASERLAAQYTWERVVRPLAGFCARPRRTAPEIRTVYSRVNDLERSLRERDAYIRHVEEQYRRAIQHANPQPQHSLRAQAGSFARSVFERLRSRLTQRLKK